jgi:hypothetical protein
VPGRLEEGIGVGVGALRQKLRVGGSAAKQRKSQGPQRDLRPLDSRRIKRMWLGSPMADEGQYDQSQAHERISRRLRD